MNNKNSHLPARTGESGTTTPKAAPSTSVPEPAIRRRNGRYLILGIVAITVLVQAAFIGYLHWGVMGAMNGALTDHSASPWLQELGKLNWNALARRHPSPPILDPNTVLLPPGWDGGVLPRDQQPAPPVFDPNAPYSLDDMLGLFDPLNQSFGSQFPGIDMPPYPSPPDNAVAGWPAPMPARPVIVVAH